MNFLKLLILALLTSVALTNCKKEQATSNSDTDNSKTSCPNCPIDPTDPTPEGMVFIHGTTYLRGTRAGYVQENGKQYFEESPQHQVTVSSFFIDETEVTNAQFKKFVDATGYLTRAERGFSQAELPKAPRAALIAGAMVFIPPHQQINPHFTHANSRWVFTPGASWKTPNGPGSSIEKLMDHPVVCINHEDAEAYAKWAGKRLPTEAEWELAARGGLKEKNYVWGDERHAGKWLANCFQGTFPNNNTAEDGFSSTAPVKSFPANGYGLYDMAGNVWEICSDYYHPGFYQEFVKAPHANPTGSKAPITTAQMNQWYTTGKISQQKHKQPKLLYLRVTKGGSYLCHVSYCLRYRPAARHYLEPASPTNHTGFRCVKDAK